MNKEALIEKYFSNQLTEADFQQLEQLLEVDTDFQQDFYSQLELQQAISQLKHKPLKERLQQLEQPPASKQRWYLYAAAIALMFAIGFVFYNSQPDYQDLYAAHFEAYPNVVSLTNRSDAPIEKVAKEAFDFYDAQQYKEAARSFQEVYKQQPQDDVYFYYGLSLMANGDIAEGMKAFETYPWLDENSDFTVAAHWYMGLGYIQLENLKEARFYLQKVADGDNNLSHKAKEVLAELH